MKPTALDSGPTWNTLAIPYTMSLFIKTEAHPEGFIDIPLENIENQWHPQMFMLSATMNNFVTIEKDIKQRIQTNLDASYPNYEIDDNEFCRVEYNFK